MSFNDKDKCPTAGDCWLKKAKEESLPTFDESGMEAKAKAYAEDEYPPDLAPVNDRINAQSSYCEGYRQGWNDSECAKRLTLTAVSESQVPQEHWVSLDDYEKLEDRIEQLEKERDDLRVVLERLNQALAGCQLYAKEAYAERDAAFDLLRKIRNRETFPLEWIDKLLEGK